MNKDYKIITKIIESTKINENDKVYFIQSYLLHWMTEDEIQWIWE